MGTSFLMGDGWERRSDRREDDILWEGFFSGYYTKCKFCIIEGSEMRGKRHIAQNACISLCGVRRLQDKYITIFAFTLATRHSVSRQTYQTARSFRRTRLRRTVEDACPYSLRVALIVGRILWVAFCGSHFAGRILWVAFCGSHFAGRILRVVLQVSF